MENYYIYIYQDNHIYLFPIETYRKQFFLPFSNSLKRCTEKKKIEETVSKIKTRITLSQTKVITRILVIRCSPKTKEEKKSKKRNASFNGEQRVRKGRNLCRACIQWDPPPVTRRRAVGSTWTWPIIDDRPRRGHWRVTHAGGVALFFVQAGRGLNYTAAPRVRSICVAVTLITSGQLTRPSELNEPNDSNSWLISFFFFVVLSFYIPRCFLSWGIYKE